MNEVEEHNTLDINRKKASLVCKAKSLKELRKAIKDLGLYEKQFTIVVDMSDLTTGEYTGFYFFSSKPVNLDVPAVELEKPISGKLLALFLLKEMTNPSIELYAHTKDKKLGGWELWSDTKGDDFFLAADRILLGSMTKAN